MATIIGSARIDEHGNAAGGAAGDQTGREVCTENYYVHAYGWYCTRAKDPAAAERIAAEMKAACANDNIGYDQNQRLGIITVITKAKTMSAVDYKTECDCSSLVRACVMAAGLGDPGNFTTYNETKVLDATGKFEPRIAVESGTPLYNGDILTSRKKSHTVIVCSGIPRVSKEDQKGAGLNKTPKWVGKVVRCNLLNVRSWYGYDKDGKLFPVIKKYPQLARGNKVDVCEVFNLKDGTTWYYIRIAGSIYGFVNGRYIDKA